MAVRDWLNDFLNDHRARFDPPDWPDTAEEFAAFKAGWVKAFALVEATRDEADAASLRLAATPPRYRRDHIPAVVASIRDERAMAAAASLGPAADSRESAEQRSRACRECQGNGLASRHASTRSGRAGWFSFYCVCPLGRWIMRSHRDGNGAARDAFARMGDLARRPDLLEHGDEPAPGVHQFAGVGPAIDDDTPF